MGFATLDCGLEQGTQSNSFQGVVLSSWQTAYKPGPAEFDSVMSSSFAEWWSSCVQVRAGASWQLGPGVPERVR